MTGTTTSLARESGRDVPDRRGTAARFLAFVRRPRLPDRAAGFSRENLAAVLRLYALDLALMAVLMALASAAIGAGIEMPENEINSLKLTPGMLALIVLFAPAMEEIVFRSWLSGRPGHVLGAIFLIAALVSLALFGTSRPMVALALVSVTLISALLALFTLRRRAPIGWFARFFPLFYALATVTFALVHLFNYKQGAALVLLPLVVPQLIAGAIFGYARVLYGMWANILLHTLHNGTAIGLVLLATEVGVAGT